MGASAPGGRSGASIRRQMQTDAGGRDPNAMGGFRNSPLRQEERRPQAGVQDARDKFRDAIGRRDTFERVSQERENAANRKAMNAMFQERAEREMGRSRGKDDVQAGGPGGYFRGRGPRPGRDRRPERPEFSFGSGSEIGGMGAPSDAAFMPNPAADLSSPGGEKYGDVAGNLNRMNQEKEMARSKADARQSAFAQYQAAMAKKPQDNQFGGENVLSGFQPTQGFGAYMSQMQTPDSRSQTQFRDRFLGMADLRNAMGGEQQQKTFRAQQFRPEYGQENVGTLRYLRDPGTLPPGTF